MKTTTKHALVLATAGILAISAATPSFARGGRVAAAAGIGFIAGAVIGAAAANANTGYYYGPDYAYDPVYYPAPGYAYVPAPAPVYSYPAPAYGYAQRSYAYVPSPSGNPSFDVYDKGQYVGSDPDPRIRDTILRESRGQ